MDVLKLIHCTDSRPPRSKKPVRDFNCRQLISYVSGIMTIKPGDILFTGTPQGVIFGEKMPPEERRWLQAGDEILSAIEGLGELRITLA